MGRGAQERAVLNVVELRGVQIDEGDEGSRARRDRVLESLREQAGPAVKKAAAARILGVSRNTLNKWVDRGLIPTRNGGVDRGALEEIALEVETLRELAEKNPAVLAEALGRIVGREPELIGLEEQIAESLKSVEKGELVPLRIPETFGPDD